MRIKSWKNGASNNSDHSLKVACIRVCKNRRFTASKLLPRLRGQIPSLITIDGRTFTAAEALQVMARVFLGDAAVVTPVADPDPYAPGGGWGASKGI